MAESITIDTCLKDWIGIKWKNGEIPGSGVYINQLPGVSLKSIDYLANAEQVDFLGVWDDVQVRSLKRLQTHVVNYFAKRYQLKPVNESLLLPEYFTNGAQNTAAGANYRGFTFDLGWYGSPLASIHIESLRLYSTAAVSDLEIKVFNYTDSGSAVVADTLTQDVVVGWNDITVQKDYPYHKILVGYDATQIESVYMPLSGVLAGPWYNTFFYWGPPQSPYQGILRGAQTDKPYGNTQEGSNLYGLSGKVSVTCAYDSILCANKKVFTNCLWYLLGAELMFERVYSDRLNRYTTIDAKKAADLRKEFEGIFQEEMKATFDGIELTTWDGCLTCEAQVRLEHSLP
jgi:hypothetical protein